MRFDRSAEGMPKSCMITLWLAIVRLSRLIPLPPTLERKRLRLSYRVMRALV
jgi:hypothetical protein